MKIPFLSFGAMNADVKAGLMLSFEQCIDSGWYILGEQVKKFEQEYAAFSGSRYCAGVANGLDALVISLKALNIGPGDEVIVPSNTYIASWLAVSYVGARPVPVEPRLDTYNINPEAIEEKISSRCKAIMPVHLYGQSCEMQRIMQIAQQHGLFVVEDNAQAQGAQCQGQLTGSFGHINGTSFYPGKNLGAYGDAGAITTNDETLLNRAFTLRNYGSAKKYYNEEKGMNSRLDEMQAGFLSVKLKHLSRWTEERQKIAASYEPLLQNCGDLVLPQNADGCSSVYHLYVIRTSRRDALADYLNQKGIGTLIHYPLAPHLQQAYRELNFKAGDFPLAEEIAGTCLSLPLYPGLQENEIQYIAESIQAFYHG